MSNLENFAQTRNSFTGTFGTGQVKFFYANDTFVVPAGITAVRARVWGSGSRQTGFSSTAGGGGGGGFALKKVTGLSSGASISVTVGTSNGASSSFGPYVSATGGVVDVGGNGTSGSFGGSGVGGDINTTGGRGGLGIASSPTSYGGGGGSASVFGNGGEGARNNDSILGIRPDYYLFVGGATGGGNYSPLQYSDVYISEEFDIKDLDFIGTGRGSHNNGGAINGGGGWAYGSAVPAGGGSRSTTQAQGLVILEY